MKSMTGMGRAQGIIETTSFRIEIKSINHRFCEVSVRLPGRLAALEIPLQQHVKKKLSRGKIDVFIFEDRQTMAGAAEVQAYANYYAYLSGVQKATAIPGEILIQDLLPGVGAWMQKSTDTDSLAAGLHKLLDAALTDLEKMRTDEGKNLETAMKSNFANIQHLASHIQKKAANAKQDLEKKLRDRIAEKLGDIEKLDPERLHSEVIFYLDRMDITEELQRIDSHFKQVQTFFKMTEPNGRKLDFLLQEFNREFNTIASKCSDSEIAHWVVDVKAELEKIREQIQNVE